MRGTICREEPVFAGKVTCGVRNETSGQSWSSNTVATDAFYQTVTDRIISSLKADMIPREEGSALCRKSIPARGFGVHFMDELYSKEELVAGQGRTLSLVQESWGATLTISPVQKIGQITFFLKKTGHLGSLRRRP